MDSALTPIDLTSRDPSIGPSESSSNLPKVFNQMIRGAPVNQKKELRDRCRRPEPIYNYNYNPFAPPPEDRRPDYSPYIVGEPLHDDREVILARLPKKYVLEGSTKRKKTAWVWKLGYALTDTSKANGPPIWACKFCMLFFILERRFTNLFARPP